MVILTSIRHVFKLSLSLSLSLCLSVSLSLSLSLSLCVCVCMSAPQHIWKATSFSKGRYLRNSDNTLMKFKKIVLFKTTWLISIRFGIKHPWVKGTQVFKNQDHSILKKEIMGFFSVDQRYDIIIALLKFVYLFELDSQVSNLSNGPLVSYVTQCLHNYMYKLIFKYD